MSQLLAICKHERLVKEWQGDNEQLKIKMDIFEGCGHKESIEYKTFTEQITYNELHIKHSGYMIRLFKNYIENLPGNCPKFNQILKILLGLIKAGGQDIEDSMSKLVQYGYYNEQEYKTHMEGFMAEINNWDRFK